MTLGELNELLLAVESRSYLVEKQKEERIGLFRKRISGQRRDFVSIDVSGIGRVEVNTTGAVTLWTDSEFYMFVRSREDLRRNGAPFELNMCEKAATESGPSRPAQYHVD